MVTPQIEIVDNFDRAFKPDVGKRLHCIDGISPKFGRLGQIGPMFIWAKNPACSLSDSFMYLVACSAKVNLSLQPCRPSQRKPFAVCRL
jgi:hypothetical protein